MLRALALASALVVVPAFASAQEPCTTNDARQVVNLIYSHFLERAAGRGSDTHVQQLRNGAGTVRDVVAAVVKSTEYDRQFLPGNNREAAVRNLYRHLLERNADSSGLRAHSEGLVNEGKDAVIDSILNSAEYQQKYGDNGVPGAPGVRYCQTDRALGTTGAADTRFRGMDTNRDGVISRSEWRGTRQAFEANDWNRDNILSGDEVQAGARRRTGALDQDAPFGGSTDREQTEAWAEAEFDDVDFNGDGRITEAEWVYGYQAFNRVDSNRDGVITWREFDRSRGRTGR
jgi:Ca2+-binding EF-hand superfamily protein